HPDISEDRLREHVDYCVRNSSPGPHVFLLVLQLEGFTEEKRQRLQSVLELFSDGSFDHSLVLLSTPREKSSGLIENYMQRPLLGDLFSKCQHRLLWQTNLERPELLTVMGQIVKENNGDHVTCDVFEDAKADLPGGHGSLKQGGAVIANLDPVRTVGREGVCLWMHTHMTRYRSRYFSMTTMLDMCNKIQQQWRQRLYCTLVEQAEHNKKPAEMWHLHSPRGRPASSRSPTKPTRCSFC
uniref:GTPase IMAP family member 2-like n=1 Tax=Monopterus albus TaxID=43700 RepID=UPI0009B3B4B2